MWSAGLVSVFWALANGLELELSERWHGRHCCQRARLEGCRRACLQARSADDLEPWCRRSDELDLQSCLLEGRGGGSCCPLATTAACRRRACSGQRQQQQREQRQQQQQEHPREDERCTEPHVTRCLRNATRASATHKVHCCSQAASGPCRDACLHVLRAAPSEAVVGEDTREDAVDTLLAAGCAAPGLHERLWQCLLGWTTGPSSSSFQQLPADGAKLQCCLRAATIECQRMCLRAYGSEWETSWEAFHGQCRYQAAEAALRQCLDDVDEPCELGCPGRAFSFCSHLSGVGKPWALFRRCDASADRAAQASAQLWMRRGPPALPGEHHQVDALAGALRGCPAHAWKELACVLHLRPCHATHHASTLCRADCLALAAQCSDGRKLAPLCDSLAPPGAPCISISSGVAAQADLTTSTAESSAVQPCRSRPCGGSTMCVVNRQCSAGQPCSLYRCLPGCPVGSSSSTLVPMGSLARLPRRAEGGRLCWTRCRCSESGALVDCAPTGCGDPAPLRCWVAGRSYASGSHFFVHGCMRCRCEAGQVSCSRTKDCALSVPCGCPREDVPEETVCGDDGRSHRSACLARCSGLLEGQWRKGPCQQVDPCADQLCPVHAPTCVAQRRPCLGPCKQHVCLPNSTDDRGADCGGPVCDEEQREHASLCALMRRGGNLSSLAYRGSCERACRPGGTVCGLDGETHTSECAARAQRVLVDYRGHCLHRRPEDCDRVLCPLPMGGACPLPLLRLPSACCPVCGSGLRLALGQPWAEGDEYPLSELLWWLRAQLSSPECDLFGHLDPALPSFLVVLVVPTTRPTLWALCRAEAQRLDALVRGRSAALFSLLPMAAVTGSAGLLEEELASSSAQRSAGMCSVCLLQLLLVLIVAAGSSDGTQRAEAGGTPWSSPNTLHRPAPSRRTNCEQTSSARGEVS